MIMEQPQYIFETSWEVCNRVGGIYTVLSTRAASMQKEHKDKVFFIGPDVWGTPDSGIKSQESGLNTKPICPYFKEVKSLLAPWQKQAAKEGLEVRVGRWDIPGRPIAILVNFDAFWAQKDSIYAHMWERFGVDSLHAYGDYDESSLFGYATGVVMESLYRFYKMEDSRVVAHFNEWMTSFGLFYVKEHMPKVGTLFTTHATSIGRSIAGNNKPLYDYFEGYNGDQMARELNMEAKHSCEKQAAHYADCFTTVSEITNKECTQLLDKPADIVTPNGFEGEFVPATEKAFAQKRQIARTALREVAEKVLGYSISDEPLFICTSGRYEWKNKGIDVFLHSLRRLSELAPSTSPLGESEKQDIVAFVMVPAWQCGGRTDWSDKAVPTTHNLCQPEHDPTLQTLRFLEMNNDKDTPVKVIFVPSYLNGDDGVFNMPYYDLLIGMDLTVFPSYYEPWGYTPLEASGFHVPTITTCLSGYGQWAASVLGDKTNILEGGIAVANRTDSNWGCLVEEIAQTMYAFVQFTPEQVEQARKAAAALAEKAAWKYFFEYYRQAYAIALNKER